MNDSSSKAQGQRSGVYATRKTGATASAPTAYKAIDLADVVSGQFDDEDAADAVAQELGKRVLAPQTDSPKLHKVLAQAGMGSRLEMEKLITEGRIAVNNELAHVGQRVQYGDQIKVDGKPIRIRIDPPPARVIAYHKPAGEIVSHDDPQNRPSVFRKLPRLQNGKWQSVGRLDLNTEGLLLFTSSGELANQLMHPRFGLEREYAVRVLGALSKDEKQKLLDGVMLDDGPAQFGSIEDGGGEGSNCWYRVTISEGRNREVRRMMESVGHAVSRLIRIRYGAMVLPHGLRRGAWLELDEADIRALMRAAGTSERARPVTEQPTRTNRNDRRPRTGGQGRAGTAVPRAKPAAKPNQAPGGSGLHAKSDVPKSEAKYIGAESFNRLKKAPATPGRGGRGGGGRSR
jgi:23S rRNA pseudouridine2605 synthase